MHLQKLTIELMSYGPDKGKYMAEIRLQDNKFNAMTIQCGPTLGERVLALATDELIAAADRGAAEFRDKILAAVGQKQIGEVAA